MSRRRTSSPRSSGRCASTTKSVHAASASSGPPGPMAAEAGESQGVVGASPGVPAVSTGLATTLTQTGSPAFVSR